MVIIAMKQRGHFIPSHRAGPNKHRYARAFSVRLRYALYVAVSWTEALGHCLWSFLE